jgi:hypothetical protein
LCELPSASSATPTKILLTCRMNDSFMGFIKEEFTQHDDAVVSKRGVDGRQLLR